MNDATATAATGLAVICCSLPFLVVFFFGMVTYAKLSGKLPSLPDLGDLRQVGKYAVREDDERE